MSLPDGIVAPRCFEDGKRNNKVTLADKAPIIWLTTYGMTCLIEKLLLITNAIVTAGLRCAPEVSPKAYIIAMTIKPKVMAIPTCVIVPFDTSFITIDPVPQKTRPNVPINSEIYFFINE